MKRFLLLLSFFIFYTNLYAQDQQQLETVRLRWQAVDYTLQYEIIVEQQTDENTFVKVSDDIKKDTTEIECRLPAGKYRYQVIAYDIFERGIVPSDWFEFEVEKRTIVQKQVQDEEQEQQQAKKYYFEFMAAFAYSPIIPFINGYQEKAIAGNFQPLSASFRLSAIPFKLGIGNLGFEFSPSVSLLEIDVEAFIVNSVILDFGFNALYQRPLNKNMLINVRLGSGMSIFYNFYLKNKRTGSIYEFSNIIAPLISGAASFQYNINKILYTDAGLAYKIMFFSNATFHFLSPFISIGGKF